MASRNGRISAGLSLFDGAARICESRDRGVTAAGTTSEARGPPRQPSRKPARGRRTRPRPGRPAEAAADPAHRPFDGPYAAIGQAAILRLGRRAAPEQTAAAGIETDSTMTSASPAERERAHGLAVFAAATFLLGMGLIAVLERVGAPNGFVQALGPLLALLGVCVIGVLTRAPNLLDFLAARRSAPTFYGGLAFAAAAAGLVMAMASASGGVSSLPWRGVILGLAGAALFLAPALRGAQASGLPGMGGRRGVRGAGSPGRQGKRPRGRARDGFSAGADAGRPRAGLGRSRP